MRECDLIEELKASALVSHFAMLAINFKRYLYLQADIFKRFITMKEKKHTYYIYCMCCYNMVLVT